MASNSPLIELPNEILFDISKEVLPDDIENFANTCRHLHSVARPAVEEHRKLKKVHAKIMSVRNCRPGKIFLTYCVPKNWLSYYPEELVVDSTADWSTMDENDQAALTEIQSMTIGKEGLLAPVNMLRSSAESTRICGAINAVLALCLPNLKTIYLKISGLSSEPEIFAHGFIETITGLIAHPTNPHVLSRLSCFRMGVCENRVLPTDLERLLLLLTLPSLKTFETNGFPCNELHCLPFAPHTSKVETLFITSLKYSIKSIVTLPRFLAHLRH